MAFLRSLDKRQVFSWALYDWANSAFATTVLAGFFPLFFKQFWREGIPETQSNFELGIFNSAASFSVALMAPVLGAIADRGGAKLRFLAAFTVLGALSTGALFFVAQSQWILAGCFFALGMVGFSGGLAFYDSLIVSVSDNESSDVVSALGYSLGYLGGGVLFAVNVLMTLKPALFGLASASHAIRISFLSVAAWWLLFSIPLFLYVREKRLTQAVPMNRALGEGLRQLADTFREMRRLRILLLFFIAFCTYSEGVNTIIRMAVAYGASLQFDRSSLILALLITQFVGFPAAILFGKIGGWIGAKRGILIALLVYMFVTVWGFYMKEPREFYIMAILIGLVQGGVQSLSRSLYSRLIPQDKAAQFFGFYNMLGKFAAVIGPILMGVVGYLTNEVRYSILAILPLFLLGGGLLLFVDEKRGQEAARSLEDIA